MRQLCVCVCFKGHLKKKVRKRDYLSKNKMFTPRVRASKGREIVGAETEQKEGQLQYYTYSFSGWFIQFLKRSLDS